VIPDDILLGPPSLLLMRRLRRRGCGFGLRSIAITFASAYIRAADSLSSGEYSYSSYAPRGVGVVGIKHVYPPVLAFIPFVVAPDERRIGEP